MDKIDVMTFIKKYILYIHKQCESDEYCALSEDHLEYYDANKDYVCSYYYNILCPKCTKNLEIFEDLKQAYIIKTHLENIMSN